MHYAKILTTALLIGLLTGACKQRDPGSEAPDAKVSAAPEPPAVMPAATTSWSVETTVIGPFTGADAKLHPDNLEPHRIAYYGTDLGFTYRHGDQLQLLFGDTMAYESGEQIEASSGTRLDDSFGSIDLNAWPDPARFSPENIPLVRLPQNPDSDEMSAIDIGYAMEGFKTPVGGLSNGSDEYGVFFNFKPQGCVADSDCSNGMTCDTGLGYIGQPYTDDAGVTFGCVEGSSPACIADTMKTADEAAVAGSGFCADHGSTAYVDSPMGRVGAVGVYLLVGTRSTENPKFYTIKHHWLTNRFMNVALRTVRNFAPSEDAAPDFRTTGASENDLGAHPRVFMWGRPGFVGVNSTGRALGMYFAYVDLPRGQDYEWKPQYYSGTDDNGVARFSANEADAAAVDLDSSQPGIQTADQWDVVDQISVAWVEPLGKWVMFYGGGMINLPIQPYLPLCGVLELFVGPECTQVVIGDGAFHMRTADHPWGPWSAPQDIIAGGDPAVPGSGQYRAGGVLRHPSCTQPGCAPHTSARDINPDEYGFFYSSNIIDEWTRPSGTGVDIIWNASTWDPYRIVLLRTHIEP